MLVVFFWEMLGFVAHGLGGNSLLGLDVGGYWCEWGCVVHVESFLAFFLFSWLWRGNLESFLFEYSVETEGAAFGCQGKKPSPLALNHVWFWICTVCFKLKCQPVFSSMSYMQCCKCQRAYFSVSTGFVSSELSGARTLSQSFFVCCYHALLRGVPHCLKGRKCITSSS